MVWTEERLCLPCCDGVGYVGGESAGGEVADVFELPVFVGAGDLYGMAD